MSRLSFEATLGLVFEVIVGILDHLHVRDPLIIWGLFVVGLLLIIDSIIRGEWAEKIENPQLRLKRRLLWGYVSSPSGISCDLCAMAFILKRAKHSINGKPGSFSGSATDCPGGIGSPLMWIEMPRSGGPPPVIIIVGPHP
jgi:hypothetical protein